MAPSKPSFLNVDEVGGSWIYFCWQRPYIYSQLGISRYRVHASRTDNGIITIEHTMSNLTRWNLTGLQPNVEYRLRVQGVTTVLEMDITGELSDPITTTTPVIGNCSFLVNYQVIISTHPL